MNGTCPTVKREVANMKRHDFIHDVNSMSFPQGERVGNLSFAERFRTSAQGGRNDTVLLTHLAGSGQCDETES